MEKREFRRVMGKILWAFRKCKGLSQEQLAEMIGLSPGSGSQFISNIEKGRSALPIKRALEYEKAIAPDHLPPGTIRLILIEFFMEPNANPFRALVRWLGSRSLDPRLQALRPVLETGPMVRVPAGHPGRAPRGPAPQTLVTVMRPHQRRRRVISYAKSVSHACRKIAYFPVTCTYTLCAVS